MSTFNVFGSRNKEYGRHIPVWLGTVSPLPVGGSLASGFAKKGILIPAGTPINIAAGVITPAIVCKVKSTASGVITIDPSAFGGFVPSVGMYAKVVGASFNATAGTAITAVAANASDPSLVDVTVALSGVNTSSVVAFSIENNIIPNAYLYNDICIDEDAENLGASGAAVVSHAEGILVDRTPAALVASAMKAAVPNVIQVNG